MGYKIFTHFIVTDPFQQCSGQSEFWNKGYLISISVKWFLTHFVQQIIVEWRRNGTTLNLSRAGCSHGQDRASGRARLVRESHHTAVAGVGRRFFLSHETKWSFLAIRVTSSHHGVDYEQAHEADRFQITPTAQELLCKKGLRKIAASRCGTLTETNPHRFRTVITAKGASTKKSDRSGR